MHEVLVNRLGGLSLPRKSVVRLTDRPDMTLDVYRGRKTTMQQQQQLKQGMKIVTVSVYLVNLKKWSQSHYNFIGSLIYSKTYDLSVEHSENSEMYPCDKEISNI